MCEYSLKDSKRMLSDKFSKKLVDLCVFTLISYEISVQNLQKPMKENAFQMMKLFFIEW